MVYEGMEGVGTYHALAKLQQDEEKKPSTLDPSEEVEEEVDVADDGAEASGGDDNAATIKATEKEGQKSNRGTRLALGGVFASIGAQSQRAISSFLQKNPTIDENASSAGEVNLAMSRWKLAGRIAMTMPGSEPHNNADMQREELEAAGEPTISKANRPRRTFHGGTGKAERASHAGRVSHVSYDADEGAGGVEQAVAFVTKLPGDALTGGRRALQGVLSWVAAGASKLAQSATEAHDALEPQRADGLTA